MKAVPALSPLERHFALFMERLNGAPDPALFAASALLCRCGGEGHVCLDLASADFDPAGLPEGLPASPEKWIERLEKCRVVGRPGQFRPLILDNAGRLYTERVHSCESGLAKAILSRIEDETTGFDPNALKAALEKLFPTAPADAAGPDRQKIAALTAFLKRFSVISGGPGTGKTRTAARIIALILMLEGESAAPVLLCAPTGKAAQRLQSAVARARDELAPLLPKSAAAAFPESASTIHHLLGMRPGGSGSPYGPDNPLAAGTLIADEASMIDLALMGRLFSALSPKTRVILLGDRNQLASVDPGSVLGDLCAIGTGGVSEKFASKLAAAGCPTGATPETCALSDSVAYLTRNYRFGEGSETATLAGFIINGDEAGAVGFLKERTEAGGPVSFVEYGGPAGISGILRQRMLAGYREYLSAASPAEALGALDRFRVLAAHRQGPGSTAHANEVFERALLSRGVIGAISPGYHRRGIIITKNDRTTGLKNGDTGVMFDGRAWFYGESGEPAAFAPPVLPDFETVFAMTVHKSQGAEFDEVLIVLPPAPSKVLTRELLYTAVTRSRGRVTLAAPADVVACAVRARVSRRSGLSDMLAAG